MEDEDAYYWANIVAYMVNMYNNEELITTADELHEGVLYWMNKDDIVKLMENARRGDQNVEKRLESYYTDMKRLEITLYSTLGVRREPWQDRRKGGVHYSATEQRRQDSQTHALPVCE
eukprot:5344050-Amphidinium_carterae.1